jgi:hypothetical protein
LPGDFIIVQFSTKNKMVYSIKCLLEIQNYSAYKSKHCTRSFSIKPKIAKITPLFESGGMSLPGNYRSISVLSTLSKNAEKHVATHLCLYLSKVILAIFRHDGKTPCTMLRFIK